MGLTMEEEAKLETIHLSGEVLAELLHHPNEDIAENALATFQNCSELPAARAIIESLLDDEDLLYVYPEEPL
jgi:S-methylmethionine-dependent homocysteine/selenocysteine methylase